MAMAMVAWLSVSCSFVSMILLPFTAHVLAVGAASSDARVSADTLKILAYHYCSDDKFPGTASFAGAVPYASSLDRLTVTLVSSASSSLSHMTFSGSGNATVYGAYLCRGDINFDECHDCVSYATRFTSTNCSQAVNATVVFEGCIFFYQNASIIPDNTIVDLVYSETFNDDITFSQACQSVLTKTSAAAPDASNFYSAASEPGGNVTVYGYAQCYGYLTSSECKQCLSSASDSVASNEYETGLRVIRGSCIFRYEDHSFLNLIPSRPNPQTKRAHLITIIVVACLFLGLAGVGFFVYRKCAITAYKPGKDSMELHERLSRHPTREFTKHELKAATKNFHDSSKLGKGGFGIVYKGTLPNGDDVAIKKLMHVNDKSTDQFLAEVKAITVVRHRNLIQLLGCCVEGQFLIFEYMPNQSLDKHIFEIEGNGMLPLRWSARRKIILGTAKGLKYLHHESNECIIHRDIKAANILLDDNLEPKIADFGLARFLPFNQSHLYTEVLGTRGYLAPETAVEEGKVTTNSDTYSFGMVVLEILSGRRVIDPQLPSEQANLQRWAKTLHEKGQSVYLMDQLLKREEYSGEEVSKLVQLALQCTQKDPKLRPLMSEVVRWLEGEGKLPDVPQTPERAAAREFDDRLNDPNFNKARTS